VTAAWASPARHFCRTAAARRPRGVPPGAASSRSRSPPMRGSRLC